MKSPFRSQFKVTQAFGVNAEYYKQFGLRAHEGLDIIPIGSSWDVLSLTDGVVVKDEENKKSGAYGNYLTIWDSPHNRAFQYCHLDSNTVSLGERVTKGQKIGKMGSSGNTTGAHLHLNQFLTDASGIRQNRKNGYNGGIDPYPFLASVESPQDSRTLPSSPPNDSQPTGPLTAMNINDVYRGLVGEEATLDEINYRLKQGINLYDLIREICQGDVRFKRIWVYPTMEASKPPLAEPASPEIPSKPAPTPKDDSTPVKTVEPPVIISEVADFIYLHLRQLLEFLRKRFK